MKSLNCLYDPSYEHDACGVGFLANLTGKKSHSILEQGIEVLENLRHRGATGSDAHTGDGAGLLFQIPDTFFREECEKLKIDLPGPSHYGVGMFFMPRGSEPRQWCQAIVEKTVLEEGLVFLGWRNVPTRESALGEKAREESPFVMQCFVTDTEQSTRNLERVLYIVRRQIERRLTGPLPPNENFYIPSFSASTIFYKGLMLPGQVREFYEDLQNSTLKSAAVIVHQRYSTNTFPSWALAQPFRYLGHNGEINTLRGNINWMRAREKNLKSELFGGDIEKLFPIIQAGGSDSARGPRGLYRRVLLADATSDRSQPHRIDPQSLHPAVRAGRSGHVSPWRRATCGRRSELAVCSPRRWRGGAAAALKQTRPE